MRSSSRTHTSVRLRFDETTSSTPTRHTTSSSASTRRMALAGRTQVATADWLPKHSGPVVLSNQATERIVELYESLGYHLIKLNAPRRISCTGDRTPATEVLAIRNPPI